MGSVPVATVRAELACHWRHAHDLPRVARRLRSRPAWRRGASTRTAEALRHLERALELWDRVPDAAERAGMSRSDVLRAAAAVAGDAFEAARAVSLQREALAERAEHATTASSSRACTHELRPLPAARGRARRERRRAADAALELLPPEAELERATPAASRTPRT